MYRVCDECGRGYMNEQNIADLRRVNWLAKADSTKKSLCYKVKGILLSHFGVHDGYDLQMFTRARWADDFRLKRTANLLVN